MAPEPTPEQEPKEEKTTEPVTLDKVQELISNALGGLFDSGKADVKESKPAGTDKPKGSISEEVRQELERLRTAESEEDWKKGISSEIDRLKGLAENTPVEKRPSKFSTWLWGNQE